MTVFEGWGEPVRFGRKSPNEYIPTWQLGRSQDTPSDYGTFAAQGYGGNSAVYSCIAERATSLADLPITLLRKTPDGPEPVENPVLELLSAPSPDMDGFEFLETLVTHFDVAGNVYIHKKRKSDDPTRKNAYAVKELGLLRPDYVSIVPGRRRADDVFEVSVNGTVQARLPRQDVIHIKTANPANDFYGLSPLAVVAQEVDLDKVMTQFDWAFFKNAGVPMGILKTKSRHSDDQTRDIKRQFRNAFSGLRKWFELLVLNADEAEYQQLAGLPKDMEMPGTREFAESRVCSVYGVPPIIVGLLVGLTRATYSNYEQAQFSFWSETMSPLAKRISAALTRELLTEFATSSDRGTYLAFDFSEVKALQEDNTARLGGVVSLIGSGGFTVNQALGLFRLPQVEGGDVYIRGINQIVEDVAIPAGSKRLTITDGVLRIEQPKEKRDSRVARDRLLRRFGTSLATFLSGQAERVVNRLPKGKAIADELLPLSEDEQLLQALLPSFTEAVRNAWTLASGEVGGSSEFDTGDPAVIRLLKRAGDNVKGINAETRNQITNALTIARDEGLSISQLKDLLRNLPAFTDARAETVARTELARADNQGAIERYRTSGIVDEVQIIDGPECGWTEHDDPDLADGSIRSLEDFEQYVISHPRCVRSRSPVIRGG